MTKTPVPRLSIRARLILLALLAVVPLTLDRVRLLEASRTERIDMTSKDVLDLARRGADAQVEMIDATRAVLAVVARTYATLARGGQDCATFLAGFAVDVPWIRALSVVGPDDRIVCSTREGAAGLNMSDRPYIGEARQSRAFVLSDYLIERPTNQPAIMAAYSTLAKDENVDAIIVAAIDLQWVGRLAPLVEARAGATALLLDRSGTVLAEFPPYLRRGQNFADHALFRQVFTGMDGGVTAAGFDGIRRIFAFTRLAGTDARILIGLDEAQALRRIDREIGIAYLELALFGILTLLAAWYGGEQLIVEPVRALARTAGRIGRGDLEARTNANRLAPEFVPLATALTDMAVKLAQRDRELRSANRDLEALASIDGLSGLANRRSFDARLQAEWERAAGRQQPVALMMIDVDHFKMFNDNYGHPEGDQCLRAIAGTLSAAATREGDLAARYGGEEFALLLRDTDLTGAMEIARRVRVAVAGLAIAHAFAPCGWVTVSIGVAAVTPAAASGPEELLGAADASLYAAKRNGRDRIWAAEEVLAA